MVRLFYGKQKGQVNAGFIMLSSIMVTLMSAFIFLIAIPMAMGQVGANEGATARLWLAENGYVAYAAPSGDWTTLGNIYSKHIYPQASATYDKRS